MEYVVLKNSLNLLLYVELPEASRSSLEIIYFRTQDELENYLKVNNLKIYRVRSHRLLPVSEDADKISSVPDGLFVRQNDYFRKIPFADIIWIEASRSYSYIHVAGNSRIITTHPLVEVKNKLPPEQFIQIHRSFVVNRDFVDKFVGNTLYISKQSLPISRKFRDDVLSRFLFLDSMKEPPGEAQIPSGKKGEPLGNKMEKENE